MRTVAVRRVEVRGNQKERHPQGDYFPPNLSAPGNVTIGIWGQRRRGCLQEHCNPLYTALFLSGELNTLLAELDIQAEKVFSHLVDEIANQEKIQNSLKLIDRWNGQVV